MQPLSLITAPLRLIRRVLLPLLSLLIILLAVLLSVARLALPLFDEQARSMVEQAALERGLSLEVERLSLEWQGFGPLLNLHNTRIHGREHGASDTTPLELQTLSLHFDLPQSLLSGQLQFDTLEIRGLVLHLQRDHAARWGLSSLGTRPTSEDNTQTSWPTWMGMARRVILSKSQLHLVDDISGLKLSIQDLDALFQQGVNAQGQAEQRFALKMQLPASLGGNVELRAHLQGRLNDLARPSGELWLHTPQLKLQGWHSLFASLPNGDLALPVAMSDLPQLKAGELDSQIWLSLRQGVLSDIQASLDFNDLRLKIPELIPAHDLPPSTLIAPLASRVNIHLQQRDADWTFDLDTAREGTRVDKRSAASFFANNTLDAIQRFSMRREGDILTLAAEQIDLRLLRPWLISSPILPENMRRTLQRLRPTGSAQDMRLQLDLSQAPPHALGHLRVADFGWQGHEHLPGVTGLDAQIWFDGTHTLLRLASENISIDSMGQLRERLRFNYLHGDIAVFWSPHNAQQARSKIAIQALKLDNPDLELTLDARLDIPQEGSVQIDAQGSLNKVKTERIPSYLPVKILDKNAIDWLDHALKNSQGFVPHAAIRLHGALDDFPYFLHDRGHFSVIFDFEHLNLDYAPASAHIPPSGWAPAQKLYGQLRFINNGLSGIIQSGQVKEVILSEGKLSIPNFDHPRLDLSLKLHGASEHMLDVLKHSPLFKSPTDLDAIKLSGQAKLDLGINIRLDARDPKPDRVEGRYTPRNARLQTFGLDFSKLNGELNFVDLDFSSNNLSAELKQNKVNIKLKSQLAPNTAAAERGYHIELATTTQLSDWLHPAPAILQHFPGRFPLTARLILNDDPLHNPQLKLDLHSDLTGLSIDLPAPLHKAAATPRLSDAQLHFTQGTLEQLSLSQPGVLEGQFKFDTRGIHSGALHFGASSYGQRKELKANELMLSGTLEQFNLDDWLAVFNSQNDAQTSALPATLRISSKIQQAHAFGSTWDKLAVEGTHTPSGWNIELDAPHISGQIIYPTTPSSAAPVSIKLARLIFPDDAKPTLAGKETPAEKPPLTPSPIDPASLPPLHLSIGELNAGELKLRGIELTAAPQKASSSPKGEAGWLIQSLRAKDTYLEIQGQAAWRRSPEGHPFSSLELELKSDNVGAALTALGVKHALRQGSLDKSHINLRWPGGLHQFDWRGAHGQGQIHILDGDIDKVEIGVGRVLGLISLTELPRRLMLDFGDVFGDGLHFDRLDSEMRLNDGKLHSTRFELASPTLKLKASGYSNMLDQSLHYQMVATPSLGNVLPLVGTVAGGPIIGGATFVAQKLFELAGGSFVSLNYQISGTWDNPIIERGKAPTAETSPSVDENHPP